jgi:cell division topological specificity factor
MIDLIRWALQRPSPSGETARQRLRLILVMDRGGLPEDCMEDLRRDIIEAVSKYLVVDEDSVQMDMRRSSDSLELVSNIQVKEIVKAPAGSR